MEHTCIVPDSVLMTNSKISQMIALPMANKYGKQLLLIMPRIDIYLLFHVRSKCILYFHICQKEIQKRNLLYLTNECIPLQMDKRKMRPEFICT